MPVSPSRVTVLPARQGYRCEVVDVQAELKFWKAEIHHHAFHQAGTPFARYEPLFRFAYDAYLRHYTLPLEEVIESIRHKYAEVFDPWRGLPWEKAQAVLQEVWMRMGAPTGTMQAKWRASRQACMA